jgi:CheY-like chemotaxis protein
MGGDPAAEGEQPHGSHPIVACTGNVVGGSGERAIAAGCDAYVIKPCLPEQLFEQIRILLTRNARRQRPA